MHEHHAATNKLSNSTSTRTAPADNLSITTTIHDCAKLSHDSNATCVHTPTLCSSDDYRFITCITESARVESKGGPQQTTCCATITTSTPPVQRLRHGPRIQVASIASFQGLYLSSDSLQNLVRTQWLHLVAPSRTSLQDSQTSRSRRACPSYSFSSNQVCVLYETGKYFVLNCTEGCVWLNIDARCVYSKPCCCCAKPGEWVGLSKAANWTRSKRVLS